MNDLGFEAHRPRLRAVAYRVLGSLTEADDAVQETWLRFRRADVAAVENLGAWLTTVVTRVCLDVLRTRERRGEEPYDPRIPDPIVDPASGLDPEHEAVLTDAVGLALMVVLETLTPPERVAFVLHDMFAVPFEDIAVMIERTPAATRQLASRARRRVRDQAPAPDRSIAVQRAVVDGFFAAARAGDLDALVAVLDPGVVLRSDGGAGRTGLTVTVRGAREVAGQAVMFGGFSPYARPALINGAAGVTVVRDGRPLSIMAFTVAGGRIVAIDVLADPARLG
ncbi:ECF RNA polymerase sigma factor SigJ [Actinomadura rubteroloni]|uniref:ECF RNA polymerase sigma factor SigJ n=1 Tax=Actinomadura rubteroloni TaxID=1926885 RepID=A0A2P4UKY2_9ACTN|nr:sigma-70 family RNA polymerase sigma factor [Actinomadura rubteroloni]POM25649.1 ECF RNA polymerase sigma factor SigJ [Actinomadura rubteroloni]